MEILSPLLAKNGASFSNGEDTVINGKVTDTYPPDYISRQVDLAMQANKDGVNLHVYLVWSGW
jgi:beta-glucosidase/6-phospho-beta-glucosidase/beta-galactosidase